MQESNISITEPTSTTTESIPVKDTIPEIVPEPVEITPEDEKIINTFKNINPNLEDLITLVNNLSQFNYQFKSFANISFFMTEENIDILKKLNARDNIKINLLLSKIYMNLMSNESLYSNYLTEISEPKLNIMSQIIDECIVLIQKLSGFVFDSEIFNFKEKTLSLIKCIYFNCKKRIGNLTISQKLEGLVDSFPTQFYSETYNELNKDKDLYDILKCQDQEKINNFEDKFAQINSYYEQFEAFKKFVECNAGIVNYASIGETGEEKKTEVKDIDPEKIDFYQQYGMLLLKFCKYHHYIFLNTENKDEDKKKTEEETDPDNVRVVFLLDKIKHDNDENKEENDKKEETQPTENIMDKTKGNQKIVNLMNQKSFTSVVESKDYNSLIKKEITKYLEMTKNHESDPKLKTVIEQMKYFLSILDVESYVPLYLSDFSKITISDNFTPSFLTNVPAGKKNEFYLETKANETMLVYIEFSLEDKSKDISFEVNKYEIYSNEYKNIFKEEKIEDTFKFFILVGGYSLYQIIFDNYYSWFTSKDVNYRIALLKLNDKPNKNLGEGEKKEENAEKDENDKEEELKEPKKEIKEEKPVTEDGKNDENKLYCYFNGKNMAFDQKEICDKIKAVKDKKDTNLINIPVVLYLNTLRIISTENNEKISIKEYKDEDEDLITKSFFDLKLKHYLAKVLKIKQAESKDKKIIVSIFSQNRELSSLNEDIAEKINALKSKSINNSVNDPEYINYYEKIGFYPGEEIEGYKIDFKLYDLCEQSLIYHLFNRKIKNEEIKKSVLFMLFDEKVVNAAVFNEGAVFSNFKGKKNYLNNININDENGVLNFLENANDTFDGIELVLNCLDYKEDKKKKLDELIKKIKKYCQEKIKVNVIEDDKQNTNNVFNYMNLFYKN